MRREYLRDAFSNIGYLCVAQWRALRNVLGICHRLLFIECSSDAREPTCAHAWMDPRGGWFIYWGR